MVFLYNLIPVVLFAVIAYFSYRAYRAYSEKKPLKRDLIVLALGIVGLYAFNSASISYGYKGTVPNATVVRTVEPTQAPVVNRERAPLLDNTQREERYRSQLDYRERIEQSRQEAENDRE